MAQAKKLMRLHRVTGEEIFIHPDTVGVVEKDKECEGKTIIYPSIQDWVNDYYGMMVKETPEEVSNVFMSCNW